MDRSTEGEPLGRVVGLWRHPVKSMAAEALEQVDVSWFGLAGDRRRAFVRDEAVSSDFPWLTLRERGDMSHYLPSFVEPRGRLGGARAADRESAHACRQAGWSFAPSSPWTP